MVFNAAHMDRIERMTDDEAVKLLKHHLEHNPGRLQVITRNENPEAAKLPVTNPLRFISAPVTSLKPLSDGTWLAKTDEGHRCVGKPKALLLRLMEAAAARYDQEYQRRLTEQTFLVGEVAGS